MNKKIKKVANNICVALIVITTATWVGYKLYWSCTTSQDVIEQATKLMQTDTQ